MTAGLPNRLTSHANVLIFYCVFVHKVEVLGAEDWLAVVDLAERDAQFRAACMRVKARIASPALERLQAICRSVDARIACEFALARA